MELNSNNSDFFAPNFKPKTQPTNSLKIKAFKRQLNVLKKNLYEQKVFVSQLTMQPVNCSDLGFASAPKEQKPVAQTIITGSLKRNKGNFAAMSQSVLINNKGRISKNYAPKQRHIFKTSRSAAKKTEENKTLLESKASLKVLNKVSAKGIIKRTWEVSRKDRDDKDKTSAENSRKTEKKGNLKL